MIYEKPQSPHRQVIHRCVLFVPFFFIHPKVLTRGAKRGEGGRFIHSLSRLDSHATNSRFIATTFLLEPHTRCAVDRNRLSNNIATQKKNTNVYMFIWLQVVAGICPPPWFT